MKRELPAHVCRRGKAPRKAKAQPAREYAAGHFLAPVHRWFGPAWEPQWQRYAKRDYSGHENVIAVREKQTVEGIGWASGTIPMQKTPTHSRPAWMAKRPA